MVERRDIPYSGEERRSAPPASVTQAIADARAEKVAKRHGAIAKKLPTLRSYREWADKAREAWEEKK